MKLFWDEHCRGLDVGKVLGEGQDLREVSGECADIVEEALYVLDELFVNGLNLIILELPRNDITDNVNLLCPSNHYSNNFQRMNMDRSNNNQFRSNYNRNDQYHNNNFNHNNYQNNFNSNHSQKTPYQNNRIATNNLNNHPNSNQNRTTTTDNNDNNLANVQNFQLRSQTHRRR